MTDAFNPSLSRRRVLRYLAVAAGSAVGLPVLTQAATKASDPVGGPVAKSAVQYQDHPSGTSACATCANFIAGKSPAGPGHCAIVSGKISPKGWCLAYAAKG
ncbi:MAG TPA: high-potential iron-sulfur protein [Oleiagrimonas sp.]|nr:high-potential iron-sulfur protein [Oleiagrimonas sp.]